MPTTIFNILYRHFLVSGTRSEVLTRSVFITAGNQSPSPSPKIDTVFHKGVYVTKCLHPQCEEMNCANPANQNRIYCAVLKHIDQYTIPPSVNGVSTELGGNLSSKIPINFNGVLVDAKVNYSGDAKSQHLVKAESSIPIDPKKPVVDSAVSDYVRQPAHHDAIIK